MRRGVDPARHPADDRDPRERQVAREPLGDPQAVGARVARARRSSPLASCSPARHELGSPAPCRRGRSLGRGRQARRDTSGSPALDHVHRRRSRLAPAQRQRLLEVARSRSASRPSRSASVRASRSVALAPAAAEPGRDSRTSASRRSTSAPIAIRVGGQLGVGDAPSPRASWRSRAASTRSRTGAELSPGSRNDAQVRLLDQDRDVDPVGERAGELAPRSRARRPGRRCTRPTAAPRPHGHGLAAAIELEAARELDRVARAGDPHRAVLERLAQRLERAAPELGQLVEEEHAVVGERDLARARRVAAADQARRSRSCGAGRETDAGRRSPAPPGGRRRSPPSPPRPPRRGRAAAGSRAAAAPPSTCRPRAAR